MADQGSDGGHRGAWIGAGAVVIAAVITGVFLLIANDSGSSSPPTASPTSSSVQTTSAVSTPSSPRTTSGTSAAGGGSSESQSASQFLADMDPSDGTPRTGSLIINGATYPHSLRYRIGGCTTEGSVTYTVGRKWSQLAMTVGLQDASDADAVAQFEVYADGRRIYNSGNVAYGQSRPVSVPVAGALDVKLTYVFVKGDMGLCSNAGYVAWGDPTLS